MKKITYRLVYNRKHQLNTAGTALVQVEAYLEKKKKYFSTHVYIKPEQWDARQSIIIHHPHADSLNQMIREYKLLLEARELQGWKNGKEISLELLQDQPVPSTQSSSFLSFVQQEIQRSHIKESTRKNRLSTWTQLQMFRPKIQFEALNYTLLSEFESYLSRKGYHINTIAKHMKHLKGWVNAAINRGLLNSQASPFRQYKIQSTECHPAFLTPDELHLLESLTLKASDAKLQHTLDAFLFCCYTGLRYSDFTHQSSTNLVKMDGHWWLVFKTIKTGILVKLPLYLLSEGKPMLLLRKYRGQTDRFFHLKSNSLVNKELVRLGHLAQITKHFSFHTARHTNATLLLYQGVAITTVQKLLGHKKLTTTQGYSEVMEATLVRDLMKCSPKKRTNR